MRDTRTYYLFLGFHSFLIGLFPFFLPVYLVKGGSTLADVSLFIGVTGLSFCATLAMWDRLCRRISFFRTLLLSFVVESVLVFLLSLEMGSGYLLILAAVNGIYNCLFWMVQRVLFFANTDSSNSGRKFGNFQIFVTVVLKAGIFVGGLMLEKIGLDGVLILSVLSAALAAYVLRRVSQTIELPAELLAANPLKFRRIAGFSDTSGSRRVFIIDGVFLYLESYFWLISLFYLVQQSFWQLGLMVILLAIGFSIFFYMIKNRIDTANRQRMYLVGVVLYGASWLMRGVTGNEFDVWLLYVLLIVITFCTSFFRLSFNKRFFDLSRANGGYNYIFCKSYYSQFFLGLFFCAFGFIIPIGQNVETALYYTYIAAAFSAPLYLGYRMT